MIREFDVDLLTSLYKKYFALSDKEIEKFQLKLNEFKTPYEKNCFLSALSAIIPHLDPEKEQDNSVKQRAGNILLSNVEFFENNSGDVYERLSNLFYNISNVGINVYQTIYKTTLTNGDIKTWRDDDGNVNFYYDESRRFVNIYRAVRDGLNADNEQTNKIFEQAAATLIGHVSTTKVRNVINALKGLCIYDPTRGNYIYFFEDADVISGLTNCPSLLNANEDNIRGTFQYLLEKTKHAALIDKQNNPELSDYWAHKKVMQRWILNNFSLLGMNTETMIRRENYIKSIPTNINVSFDAAELFENPVTLAILDGIPLDKIYNNSKMNITKLNSTLYKLNYKDAQEAVKRYVSENPYIFGMNRDDFRDLIDGIVDADRMYPDANLMDKFLGLGKTLFANKNYLTFKVEKVIAKLKENDVVIKLEPSKDDADLLQKFCQVFYGEQWAEKLKEINDVLLARENQNAKGYTQIRNEIRGKSAEFGGWNAIVKSPAKACKMAFALDEIKDKRFAMVNATSIDETIQKENSFVGKMKAVLQDMRTVYTKNKTKLGKKYDNIDDLFKFAVERVENQLTELVSINELIEREVVAPYQEALKSEYKDSYSDEQGTLFGNKAITVGVQGSRISGLRMLNSSIEDNRENSVEKDSVEFYRK